MVIAFTFGVYVVHDLMVFLNSRIAPEFLTLIFLAASISIFYAAWQIYRSGEYCPKVVGSFRISYRNTWDSKIS